MSKKIKVVIHNVAFEINEADYLELERERNKERYRKRRDIEMGILSLNAIDDEAGTGESKLIDTRINVEDEVINNLMIEKLRTCLSELSNDEFFIIEQLIYQEKSERELSKIIAIPQKTINDRKNKILAKLKKLLENQK